MTGGHWLVASGNRCNKCLTGGRRGSPSAQAEIPFFTLPHPQSAAGWLCPQSPLAVFFNLNLLRASPQTRTQRAFFQRCRVQESIFNV